MTKFDITRLIDSLSDDQVSNLRRIVRIVFTVFNSGSLLLLMAVLFFQITTSQKLIVILALGFDFAIFIGLSFSKTGRAFIPIQGLLHTLSATCYTMWQYDHAVLLKDKLFWYLAFTCALTSYSAWQIWLAPAIKIGLTSLWALMTFWRCGYGTTMSDMAMCYVMIFCLWLMLLESCQMNCRVNALVVNIPVIWRQVIFAGCAIIGMLTFVMALAMWNTSEKFAFALVILLNCSSLALAWKIVLFEAMELYQWLLVEFNPGDDPEITHANVKKAFSPILPLFYWGMQNSFKNSG